MWQNVNHSDTYQTTDGTIGQEYLLFRLRELTDLMTQCFH